MGDETYATCMGCGGLLYDIDDECPNCGEWGSLAWDVSE